MNRTKCRHCELVNTAEESACRRCGEPLHPRSGDSYSRRSPREAARKSSWLYTILFLTVIGAGATYLFTGAEKSFDEVKSTDLNRVATQSKQQPNAPRSRSEVEEKQKQNYKTAIQTSQGLSESQKHNEDVQKLMQSEPAKTTK